MKRKLTAKQRAFIREYLVGLNATQAAIRAGYSKRSAKEIGYENLTKPDIHSEISEALSKVSRATKAEATQVVRELGLIAFANVQTLFTPEGKLIPRESLPSDLAKAIESYNVVERKTQQRDKDGKRKTESVIKIRMRNKLRALEMLLRHFQLADPKHRDQDV